MTVFFYLRAFLTDVWSVEFRFASLTLVVL